jgi:hypothetical protein
MLENISSSESILRRVAVAVLRSTMATVALLLAVPNEAIAWVIEPTSIGGLRSLNDGATVIPLDYAAIKNFPSLQDRTIANFDISGLPPGARHGAAMVATLKIPIYNDFPYPLHYNGAPHAGTLDLYVFAGNGAVAADQWDAGSLLHTFSLSDGVQTLSLDITSTLHQFMDDGATFVSFSLRGRAGERYVLTPFWNGFPVKGTHLPNPSITLSPIP